MGADHNNRAGLLDTVAPRELQSYIDIDAAESQLGYTAINSGDYAKTFFFGPSSIAAIVRPSQRPTLWSRKLLPASTIKSSPGLNINHSQDQTQAGSQQQDVPNADKVFAERDKDVLRDLIDRQLLLERGKDHGNYGLRPTSSNAWTKCVSR